MAELTDVGRLQRRFEKLGADGPRLLARYSRRVLAPRGRRIAREEIRRVVRKRSGRLENSAETIVYAADRTIITRLRLRHPGAGVLGRTGTTTIRSRRPGGSLAIPVGPALNSDGSEKYPGGPRTVTEKLGLIVTRSSATLRDRDNVVWYVLKRSITVRGRGFLPRIRSRWARDSARLAAAYTAKLARGGRP